MLRTIYYIHSLFGLWGRRKLCEKVLYQAIEVLSILKMQIMFAILEIHQSETKI